MAEAQTLREIDDYLTGVSDRVLRDLLDNLVTEVGTHGFWTAVRRTGEFLDLRQRLREPARG